MGNFFRRLFGKGNDPSGQTSKPLLSSGEIERIGTEDDLMRDYDTQAERNFQAMEAEQSGDVATAIVLYEQSVSEEFVGAHPYERLTNIYERQGRPDDALRVAEAFLKLARSGRLPRGSQRSADSKTPDFEKRVGRFRDSINP